MNVGNNGNLGETNLNINISTCQEATKRDSPIGSSILLTNHVTSGILQKDENTKPSATLHEITRSQIPPPNDGDLKSDKDIQSAIQKIAAKASNAISKISFKRQNQPQAGSDNLTSTPRSVAFPTTPRGGPKLSAVPGENTPTTPRGQKSSAVPSEYTPTTPRGGPKFSAVPNENTPSTPRYKKLSIPADVVPEMKENAKIESQASPLEEINKFDPLQSSPKKTLSDKEFGEMKSLIAEMKEEITSEQQQQHIQGIVLISKQNKKTLTDFQVKYLEKYLSKHPFNPKDTEINIKLPLNGQVSQFEEINDVNIFRTEHRDICVLSSLTSGAYKRPFVCVDLSTSKEVVTYGAKTGGVLSEEEFKDLNRESKNEINYLTRFNNSQYSLKIIDTININIPYEKETLDNEGKHKTETFIGQISMPITEKAKGTLDSLCLKLTENELVNFFDLWTKAILEQENEDFLHADIKEGNVLLSNINEPLIFDYGLSLPIISFKNNLIMGRINELLGIYTLKERGLNTEIDKIKGSLSKVNNNETSNKYRQLIKEKAQVENISKNLSKLLLSINKKQENGELADNDEITKSILDLQKDNRSTETMKKLTGALLTNKITEIKILLENQNMDSLTRSIYNNQIDKIERIMKKYVEGNERFLPKESLDKLFEMDSDLVKNIGMLYNPELIQHKEIIKTLNDSINSLRSGDITDQAIQKAEILESIKNNLDNELRLNLTEDESTKIKNVSSNLLLTITQLSEKNKINLGMLRYSTGSKGFMPFEMSRGIAPEDFANYDPCVFQSFALGRSLIGVGLKHLKQQHENSSLDQALEGLVDKINLSLKLDSHHKIIATPYPKNPNMDNHTYKNIELNKDQIKTLMLDPSLTHLEKRVILGYGMANIDWKKTLTKDEYIEFVQLIPNE